MIIVTIWTAEERDDRFLDAKRAHGELAAKRAGAAASVPTPIRSTVITYNRCQL